jgi:hypothetical protein
MFSDGGDATTASIQDTVDAFRAALGNPNNANNPGPIAGGRREINWDGGTATTSTSNTSPMATFQNRGVTLTTPGTNFLQTPLADPAFIAINATYATTFTAFSLNRIFTPVGSNITDVLISIPGSGGATPASVSGFGAVFSDVDSPTSTKLEFFGIDGALLNSFFAPVDTVAVGGLSFFGVVGNAGERIGRVRITTGSVALGPNDLPGEGADVVVMDDFIYAEPKGVPEPASAMLAIVSLAGWRLVFRRRNTTARKG